MNYPFDSITINSIAVSLSSIKNNGITGKDTFQQGVFTFLSDWLNNKEVFIQNTSGSTGKPKQIQISRQQFIKSAEATLNYLQVKAGDTALLCLDAQYIAGKMMLVRALVGQLKIICFTPDADPLKKLKAEQEIALCAMVPYQAHSLLNEEHAQKLKGIKNILIGGAALSKELELELLKLHVNAYETFGMTETISHIALRKIGEPYFNVLPGFKISADEKSCLTVKADHLGEEAINSNDIIELINYNQFKWLGRWDNVINSGGVKIIPELEEPFIAEVFKRFEIKARFYLSKRSNEKLGNEVVLVIESEPMDMLLEQSLLTQIKKELKPYHAPVAIIYLDHFQETPTGKIIRLQSLD
ncbi:MAG TPA: AMP-binding protein [Cyclobacteriaceae bacterium]|nr:AMP-binding protein [Cyclobacteriaceae bacterium]